MHEFEDDEPREEPVNEDARFPNAHVQLTGEDGNAFYILGKVTRAMQKAGATREDRDEFFAEATSGDYDHLLATCMRWVSVH